MNFLKTLYDNIIVKLIFTSTINTLFGFSVYSALIAVNEPAYVALLISNISGIVFNYFSYKNIVFNKTIKSGSLYRYVVAYGMSYAANVYVVEQVANMLDANLYLAQIICLIPILTLNWLMMNYWVYGKTR